MGSWDQLLTLDRYSLAAQNMPQFPQGFQAQFTNAAANFANYRPQFSVPGQVSEQDRSED